MWQKIMRVLIIMMVSCALFGLASADSYENDVIWIVDTWEEAIENDRFQIDYLHDETRKTLWITGYIQISPEMYSSRNIQLSYNSFDDDIVVTPNFYIHTPDNSGFSADNFTEDGKLFVRCGVRITINATDDPSQKVKQFFTSYTPKLIIFDSETGLSFESSPMFRTIQDGGLHEHITDRSESVDFAQMERRVDYGAISIKIKKIEEITEDDVSARYQDYRFASYPLSEGYRCWQIVFQLIVPSEHDKQIKLVMPFSETYKEGLFSYDVDTTFFFNGEFQYAHVDKDGRFVANLFMKGENLSLFSVCDILNDFNLTFALSCEPRMYGCWPRTRAELWTALCVYSEK